MELHHPNPGATTWLDIDLPLLPLRAPLPGALPSEVGVMGLLIVNLNALVRSFDQPRGTKTKILFEKGAFPSDYCAFLNQAQMYGYDESHLLQLAPRAGEYTLRTGDTLALIDEHADELALVCFSGIQYHTGQLFETELIAKHTTARGLTVGWYLAHAVGNVELKVHYWGEDLALWGTYKYLNPGPGGVAAILVREKHTRANSTLYRPRVAGWWGDNAEERLKMFDAFVLIEYALSFCPSNPPGMEVVAVKASLEIFQAADGITTLRMKGWRSPLP